MKCLSFLKILHEEITEKQCKNYLFNYFLYYLILIILVFVSSNFTKKEG